MAGTAKHRTFDDLKPLNMGSFKERMFEQQQEQDDKVLAEELGISYGELLQTEWHYEDNATSDGLVTQLLVVFSPNSPKEVLGKIEGIDENNTVWLDSNALSNRKYVMKGGKL